MKKEKQWNCSGYILFINASASNRGSAANSHLKSPTVLRQYDEGYSWDGDTQAVVLELYARLELCPAILLVPALEHSL
jgi:hypothetical protein